MISSLHVANSIFLRPPVPSVGEGPFMESQLRGGGGVESGLANSNMVSIIDLILYEADRSRGIIASRRHFRLPMGHELLREHR